MKNTSAKIIFFGTDNFSLTILEKLVSSNFNVVAVITKTDAPRGRGHKLTSPIIKSFANNHGIEAWQPIKVNEINDRLESNDFIGILASYGKMIPKSTLELFPKGIINVHPSLLPKYRGPSPIESTITNGDNQTGVSIIKLIDKMDAGPIYAQNTYSLSGKETQGDLYEILAKVGADLLIKILPQIINNSLKPTPQDNTKATYSTLLTKDDQWLKTDRITAKSAEKLVRAHLVYPKTKHIIGGQTVIITKAHVTNTYESPLDIKFKDGSYLSIDELVAPSGRTMKADDFYNGYLK